jgi:hypothetical protein
MWPLLVLAPVFASTHLEIQGLEANGLHMDSLQCELEGGGGLAALTIIATIAAEKSALDGCAPKGGSIKVDWAWKAGAWTNLTLSDARPNGVEACVEAALRKVVPVVEGTCSAVVRLGPPTKP